MTRCYSTVCRGMTLIELLVAMAIFAVMSASIFVAFNSFQTTKEITEKSAEQLKQYQLAFNIIARDIRQMAPRPIRDEFGDEQPALLVDNAPRMEFSRGGWNRSPFIKTKRSEIQRVAYYVEDQILMRASWRVLDRAQDTTPVRTKLLPGIELMRLEFNYQDDQEKWKVTDIWPPEHMITEPGGSGTATGQPTVVPYKDFLALPRVVTLTLKTEAFGDIYRKFIIANNYYEIFHPGISPTDLRTQGGN